MKFADEIERDDIDLIRLKIEGAGPAWEHLSQRIFGLIDSIVDRVENINPNHNQATDAVREATKDVAAIASDWVRAQVEKPSLKNEKIRVEIIEKFSKAKKLLAETQKIQAETKAIEVETANRELIGELDNLERLIRLMATMAHLALTNDGKNGHLLIGPNPKQIGPPSVNDEFPDTSSDAKS